MWWAYTYIQYSKMEWSTINENIERTMLKYLVMSMPVTNSRNSHGICEVLHIFCFTLFCYLCTKHVFKVRFGLKLSPISCMVRERACTGSYMCSLANVYHIYFITICFRQHNSHLSITIMQHVSTCDSHHQADLRTV